MNDTDKDTQYMQMALSLAQRGLGQVEPNPLVGCVIVKNDQVIGQGWHEKFGQAHAEINALNDCKKQGFDPTGSSIYVTLEPCCHTGKTGPCTDILIQAKPDKVITAMQDPTDKVSGKGIDQLQQAGIKTIVGVCEKEAARLNPSFCKFSKTARPWVILKWAQSRDGFMASKKNRWISNDKSREDVHLLRRSCQGILVGIGTVLADDPLLTPRPSIGRSPLRIVLDSTLKIPFDCKLLTTLESPTLIVVTIPTLLQKEYKAEMIVETGWDVLAVSEKENRCDLNLVLDELGKRGIQKLLVEGGATVIQSFLEENLADEVRIYISPDELEEDGDVPISSLMADMVNFQSPHYYNENTFGQDRCINSFLRPVNSF